MWKLDIENAERGAIFSVICKKYKIKNKPFMIGASSGIVKGLAKIVEHMIMVSGLWQGD